MKATGIVRRLDDLGRLVIPKELRSLHRMKDGDMIEFFINDENQIVIEKFSALKEDESDIETMCLALEDLLKKEVLFIHDDQIRCKNGKFDSDGNYGECTKDFLYTVKNYHAASFENVRILKESDRQVSGFISPINVYGDWFGSFVIIEGQNCTDTQKEVVQAYSRLLAKKHEH